MKDTDAYKDDEGYNTEAGSKEIIPSKSEVLNLLKTLGLPRNIINHVLAVSRKAIKIATGIEAVPVNLKLVRSGALLHDIGRTRSHGLDHAILGAQIIREQGYSERLALIAERHLLGGLTKEEAVELGLPPKDYLPISIEEKIVCLADKYLIGDRYVSIDMRFRNWFSKYGETKLLLTAKKRVEELELFIYKMMYP
ncbi:MAG: HDIG domain-containing metalloprotein [Promethearchaeota archaeon]